jgi:hypothetical protein
VTSEQLIKQAETYSNAIVAFTVLQGLAYCYAFGTSEFFNCLVKTAANLAAGLTLLFVVVSALAIVAILYLGRMMKQVAGEFHDAVRKIYLGKMVVVVIFSLTPLLLTLGYGVRDYPNKMECKSAMYQK